VASFDRPAQRKRSTALICSSFFNIVAGTRCTTTHTGHLAFTSKLDCNSSIGEGTANARQCSPSRLKISSCVSPPAFSRGAPFQPPITPQACCELPSNQKDELANGKHVITNFVWLITHRATSTTIPCVPHREQSWGLPTPILSCAFNFVLDFHVRFSLHLSLTHVVGSGGSGCWPRNC
jgi:hypothetical protein